MSDIYADFDTVIYAESWQFLSDNYPTLAASVKRAVDKGATPDGLRSRWLQNAGEHRIELATRIENSAKYLHGLKVTA